MNETASAVGPFSLEFCRAAELDAPSFDAKSWLTPAEAAAWAAFPSEKRRRDWLAGRVAAKRALARATRRPASECAVEPDPSGRPRPASGTASLSIAHCELGGAAAASTAGLVGVDWEPVRPLERRAVELFASEAELRGLGADFQPEDAIRLWTLKEAALKLVGLGLSSGARCAGVTWAGAPSVSFTGPALEAWRALGSPAIKFYESRDGGACLAVAYTGG